MGPKQTPPAQLVFEALRSGNWSKAVQLSKLDGYSAPALLALVRRVSTHWKAAIEPVAIRANMAGASEAVCLIVDAFGALPDPDSEGMRYDHHLMVDAISERKTGVFTALLEHGVLPTMPETDTGKSLLMVSVTFQATECVRICLERKLGGLEERDERGFTAVMICCERGTPEILRLLVQAGCNMYAEIDGRHVLDLAAAFNRIDMMEALLDLEFPVDWQGTTGRTTLHHLAMEKYPGKFPDRVSAARLLLDRGAYVHGSPSEESEEKWTPLHCVCYGGNLALAKLLLERGASVSRPDIYGQTPMHIAARHGRIPSLALLISNGADLNARSILGMTPVFSAIQVGKADAARLLVRTGCDLSIRCDAVTKSKTALLFAIECLDANEKAADFEAIVRCLVAARPKLLEEYDAEGYLPLHRCAAQGSSVRVELLVTLGAQVDAFTCSASNVRIGDGKNDRVIRIKKDALLLAAEKGNPEVLLTLLNNGANVHVGGTSKGPGSSFLLDVLGHILLESYSAGLGPDVRGVEECMRMLWTLGAVPRRRPLSPYGFTSYGEPHAACTPLVQASDTDLGPHLPRFSRTVADLKKAASKRAPDGSPIPVLFEVLSCLGCGKTAKLFASYVISSGAVPLLARLLASPQPVVQERAALSLSRLAESRSGAAHLSRVHGIVSGLMGLLSPGRRPAATHWACRCLYELCQTPLGQARFLWGLGELGAAKGAEDGGHSGGPLPKGLSLGSEDPDARGSIGTSPGRRNVTAVLSLLSREGCWAATREWAAQCLLVALRTPRVTRVPSTQEGPSRSQEEGGSKAAHREWWAGLLRRREALASAARAAGDILGPAGLALLRSSLSLDSLAGAAAEEEAVEAEGFERGPGMYSGSGSVLRLAPWL